MADLQLISNTRQGCQTKCRSYTEIQGIFLEKKIRFLTSYKNSEDYDRIDREYKPHDSCNNIKQIFRRILDMN